MISATIPDDVTLFTDYADLKKRKGYSREQAQKAFGDDIFDKIATKGKLETRRLKVCSTRADPCIGSWGDPEVFRYGKHIWEERPLSEDPALAAAWPYKLEDKPGWGRFPITVVTATDLGRTRLYRTVTYKNMTVSWTEEFENT